jgi:hypothetical protein
MAVEVQHFALEAGEGDDVQLAQVHPALFVVVRFFAQGRRQAQQNSWAGMRRGLASRRTSWLRESTAPALQFIAPFIVEAPPFVEYEEHLEAGVAKQHVRRLLPGGVNSSAR